MLSECKDQLKQLAWTLDKPVNNIYTAIKELADLANVTNQPLTPLQHVKYAYILLQKISSVS